MVTRVLPGDRILIGALLAAIALVGFGHAGGLRASSHQALATSSKLAQCDEGLQLTGMSRVWRNEHGYIYQGDRKD